jgi:hypothetical protein
MVLMTLTTGANHSDVTVRTSLTATRRTAMSLTFAAAAAAAGVNKTTLLRAIKAGKVSGNKDEHGQWHVEPPNSIASIRR